MTKRPSFLSFFCLPDSRWVNLCFMEIKYDPLSLLPPSLPADGPCGEREREKERVIIWPISAREPESVDVGWAVRCHAKPPVPRSLNMIPFTCPCLCSSSSLPPSLTPARLTATPVSSSSSSPLSPPWDRLSSTWQGLAWIAGIPGQVSWLRRCQVHVRKRNEGGRQGGEYIIHGNVAQAAQYCGWELRSTLCS